MPLASTVLTHPGLRRDSNEDSFVARPGLGLWVVCDGMGGHAAGEVASRIAADEIEAFVQMSEGADARTFTWPFGYDPSLGTDGTRLVTAFRLANRAIGVRAADQPDLRGMATTAVALLVGQGQGTRDKGHGDGVSDRAPGPESSLSDPLKTPHAPRPTSHAPGFVPALVAHVGDSRAYLWREGQLLRLTRDHSWVEEQIGQGLLSEEDARTHPWRNLVTRALSGGGEPAVDVSPLALEPGDRVLLCSDGLCGVVTDALMQDVIGRGRRGDLEAVAQTLIDAANAAGGPDNITVALVGLV